jgi:anti-sigma regulatory factor (Ser/Thr protein kinase)
MTQRDSGSESPDVVFEFEHDESAPREARRALAHIVESDAFADDVNLVASELVSNVVRHTADGGRLDAWDNSPFRVEVHDSSQELPVTRPATAEGGRGLRLVDALSSDWGAEPLIDGKVVWAEIERPSD